MDTPCFTASHVLSKLTKAKQNTTGRGLQYRRIVEFEYREKSATEASPKSRMSATATSLLKALSETRRRVGARFTA